MGNLSVDGMIILKFILIGCEGVDWIQLAQNRIQGRSLVDKLMNFQVL
jgi:hypothetical protein